VQPEDQTQSRKIKITYDDYQKIAQMICKTVKQNEEQTGEESMSQADIVNRLVSRLEVEEGAAGTSLERAEQTSRKVQQVI
jgi:hypothetical protein